MGADQERRGRVSRFLVVYSRTLANIIDCIIALSASVLALLTTYSLCMNLVNFWITKSITQIHTILNDIFFLVIYV